MAELDKSTGGRPAYSDEQYTIWLKELEPFLKRGKSLYKAIELSGLLSVKNRIYQKYNLKDWFWEKIEVFQQELGEILHDAQYDLIIDIHAKVKAKQVLTDGEIKILTFNSEKLRSAQKYWVNRFETAKGRPVEEVIGQLENAAEENIDDVAENLQQLQEANATIEPSAPENANQPVTIPDPNSTDPHATITT